MSTVTPDYRELMARALAEIRTLRTELAQARSAASTPEGLRDPIAVIGMGCRFPGGADSPDAYWALLRDGVDAIREVPPGRWDARALQDPDREAPGRMITALGGFIDDLEGFDASFFGISPREAEAMDPHQRVLLEVCWQALEHANLPPGQRFGSDCGVFVGVSSMDNVIRLMGEDVLSEVGAYHGTGCALAPIAGRVSYAFGFNGPSFVVDTACSSSLLSLHLAAASLRRRECGLALAGGVHLIFHPGYSVAFTKAQMLAPDGRCKTFDAAANGYVRGEGCGVLVLKRLEDAQRDGDRVLAVLRGSAVNQDGASGGLTVPSGPSQEQVIRQALDDAGLSADAVDYIEAHGTGTALGDPIEIGAIANVFGRRRLRVGSVKTNIGHLEASAGIASAIKVILALNRDAIPPHLHLKTPNPLIPWDETGIEVPSALSAWPRDAARERIAGISSFGFSGTNVHMLFGEAPKIDAPAARPSAPRARPVLLCLSARGAPALRALAQAWAEGPLASDDAPFAELAGTALALRDPMSHRLAVAASTPAQARERLTAFAAEGDGVVHAEAARVAPRVAFLFTGQGAQYAGMGRALYDAEPVFRETIDTCETHLAPVLGRSLRTLLFADADDGAIDATGNTQPALFALEVALARWWIALGVKPVALLGHSVGEYAAAVIAGVFSLEDGCRLIAARARLMQALPEGGAMAAVLAPEPVVGAALAASPSRERLAIAAINGPRNTVLSGDADALAAMLDTLAAEGIEARRLTVSHAFHSHRMDPMLEDFRAVAEAVRFARPTITLVSNLTGRAAGDEIATPGYWVRHAREAVRFADGVAELRRLGATWLLEVGPGNTLVGMARQVDPELPGAASQRRGEDAHQALLGALGEYWCRGGAPDAIVAADLVGPVRQTHVLPVYPFRHRRHWKTVDPAARGVGWRGARRLDAALLSARLRSPGLREDLFESVFSRRALPWIDDHRIFGVQVISGASHLSLVLAALAQRSGTPGGSLREVLFPSALTIPEDGERVTHLSIAPLAAADRSLHDDTTEAFRLVSLVEDDAAGESALHCRGRIGPVPSLGPAIDVAAAWRDGGAPVEPETVYTVQAQRGITLGASYRWLASVRRAPGIAHAWLRPPEAVVPALARHSLHPGLIDACFGVLVTAGEDTAMAHDDSFIPFAAQAVHWYRRADTDTLFAVARVRAQDAQRLLGDIVLYDADGAPVADFIGLEARRAARHALLRDDRRAPLPLARTAWEPVDPVIRPPAGRWLVLSDAQGVGDALVAALRDTGLTVFVARADAGAEALRRLPDDAFALSPGCASAFTELLQACGPLDHVVHLWALDGDPAGMTRLVTDLTAGVLHLAQAITATPSAPNLRLWLATRGAQAVIEGDQVPAPWQAIVWGMARAIGAEGGVPACACLDLDPTAVAGQAVPAMLRAACLPVAEDRIAWRAGRLQVARLIAEAPVPALASASDGGGDLCQVITGAGGALGRALAHWLASRGARHLALLSRSPPDEAFLATLRALGAQPQAWSVDVGDASALRATLAQVAAQQAPIDAVFHLAGSVDDGLITGQSAARCAAVLAPKALGAWHLHNATAVDAPAHWVLFSSVAGWLDAPGQLAYAGANAFLDALAAHRRAAGLPALSIAWGPWAELGMAARMSAPARAGLQARGLTPIAPERGWQALGSALGAPPAIAAVAVVEADWARHAGARPSAFLLRVAEAAVGSQDSPGAGRLRERLVAVGAGERSALMSTELTGLVAAVLRLPRAEIGPRVRLFDLGVDSLTALELKRRLEAALGLNLSSTLLFDFPSIDALTRHLLEEALPASGPTWVATATADLVQSAAPAENAVAALSEEEAEEALLAQLSALEEPGDGPG